MLGIKHIERWETEDGRVFYDEYKAEEYVLHTEMDKYLNAYLTSDFTINTYNVASVMSVEILKDIPDDLYNEMYSFYGFESLPREKGKWVCKTLLSYGDNLPLIKNGVEYYQDSMYERWYKVG